MLTVFFFSSCHTRIRFVVCAVCVKPPLSSSLVLLSLAQAPDTSLFLLGHHHSNQATNLRRQHKNLLFFGDTGTPATSADGEGQAGRRATCGHTNLHTNSCPPSPTLRTRSHTHSFSPHLHNHKQKISETF